ncbi:MAG: Flp pilus assembly complex ATPase component TadA [Verrucomicrobiales bacterium]|nr:Flp pilus assembly complex ATPase component TadA [Verrucomicrobiales bacterium]
MISPVSNTLKAGPPVDLGDRLLDAGVLTEPQLELARREQKRRGVALGKVLVDLAMVSPERVSGFLADQVSTAYVDVARQALDNTVVELIPRDVAREHRVLPVSQVDGTLTVAMADPCDIRAIDRVHQLTGLRVEVVAATERDIMDRLDGLETQAEDIQEAIDRIIEEREREAEIFGPQGADLAEIAEASESDSPIVSVVSQVIKRAVEKGASDIHFEPEERLMRIRFRVDGVLQPDILIPKSIMPLVSARLKVMAELDVSENRLPQDGRASVMVGRRTYHLRVSCLPTAFGESVVLRILSSSGQALGLANLGMAPDIEQSLRHTIQHPYGVMIVTGPTGSGKSTTLYAVLREVNSAEQSIFTLEDPIEYRMQGVRQTQIREDVGLTFGAGLRSLLRQDPDVMLIGETRDTETAQLMVRAALTGHLVFTTLHTNDAPGAIPRLLDMGVEPFLLPDSLIAVLAQRLVRRLCVHCREEVSDPEKVFEELHLTAPDDQELQLWRPVGCAHCNRTGYRGRQGIFEMMLLDGRFHDPIVHRAGAPEYARLAREGGMRTMFQDGIRQSILGVTTVQEVLRVTRCAAG